VATPVGYPAAGGGRGGAIVGPPVAPGRYTVNVTVPGVPTALTGSVSVEADPLPPFTASERAVRQATLMQVHAWLKALGEARLGAREVSGQRDGLRGDIGARADSIAGRAGELGQAIDRAFLAVNAQRGPIEGWSGPPTLDQRAALGFALTDARAALAGFNRLVGSEIPSAYAASGKSWSRRVAPVAVPGGG
jgi:hypothetical protein